MAPARQPLLAKVTTRHEETIVVGNLRSRRPIHHVGRRVARTKLLAAAQAVIIFLEMFPDGCRGQIGYGVEQQRYTRRPQIASIGRVVRLFVKGIAVALRPFAGYAQVEHIARDRNIEHAFEAAIVVIADIDGGLRFPMVRGLGGNEVDDACGGVASVKGSLRTTQHLYLANVEKFLLEEM